MIQLKEATSTSGVRSEKVRNTLKIKGSPYTFYFGFPNNIFPVF